jgi:hypothetical protein
MSPNPAPLLPRFPGCVAPPDVRLLWRIVLRSGSKKALLNQFCGGVAGPPGRGQWLIRIAETTNLRTRGPRVVQVKTLF